LTRAATPRRPSFGGSADGELVVAVGTATVGVQDAEKLDAYHELLLALRAIDVLKVSHAKTSEC
jgi:hypothetical protein